MKTKFLFIILVVSLTLASCSNGAKKNEASSSSSSSSEFYMEKLGYKGEGKLIKGEIVEAKFSSLGVKWPIELVLADGSKVTLVKDKNSVAGSPIISSIASKEYEGYDMCIDQLPEYTVEAYVKDGESKCFILYKTEEAGEMDYAKVTAVAGNKYGESKLSLDDGLDGYGKPIKTAKSRVSARLVIVAGPDKTTYFYQMENGDSFAVQNSSFSTLSAGEKIMEVGNEFSYVLTDANGKYRKEFLDPTSVSKIKYN